MIKPLELFRKKSPFILGISAALISSPFLIDGLNPNTGALANQGFLEFQWDADPDYKKLRYMQSSKERMDRAKYYFFLRPKERKTAILKLTVKVPDNFSAKITPKKLNICKVKIGGFTERTRCIEKIPAIIEVSEDQAEIEVFPDNPIPSDKSTYALVMKIFNPRNRGMFQLNAFSQSPGDLPISIYLGTWNIDIE